MCVCVTENTNTAAFVNFERVEQGFPINWMSVEKRIRHIVFGTGKTFFLANNADDTVTLWKETTINGNKSFYPLHQSPGENQKKVILVTLYGQNEIFLAYEPERGTFLTFTCDGTAKVFQKIKYVDFNPRLEFIGF